MNGCKSWVSLASSTSGCVDRCSQTCASLRRTNQQTTGNHRLCLFSLNDYLGLSAHPDVCRAMAQAATTCGVGPRSSALVGGYTSSHRQLETAMAQLKGAAIALLNARSLHWEPTTQEPKNACCCQLDLLPTLPSLQPLPAPTQQYSATSSIMPHWWMVHVWPLAVRPRHPSYMCTNTGTYVTSSAKWSKKPPLVG